MKIFSYFAAIILVAIVSLQTPAQAQLIDPLNVEPDANGVDMIRGTVSRPVPVLAIPAAPNLRLERLQLMLPVATGSETGFDPVRASVQLNTGTGASESFQCLELICWTTSNGSTMTMTGSGTLRTITYRQGGTGMRIIFNSVGNLLDNGATEFFSIYPASIAYPNGESLVFAYEKVSVAGGTRHRPTAVISNLGYRMLLSYQSDNVDFAGWTTLSEAAIYRTADMTTPLARHTYGTDGSITDLAGRTWSCCADALDTPVHVSSITQRLPGMTNDSFEAVGTTNHSVVPRVAQIVSDGVTWNYAGTETTGTGKCTINGCDLSQLVITGPGGFERTITNDVVINPSLATVVTSVTNRLDANTTYTTHYGYDGNRRLTLITYPRGNAVEVEYDDFGNIITRRERAVTYPTDVDLIQRAEFDTPSVPPSQGGACTNVLCFLPTRTRDTVGYWTDYIWATHGGNVKTLEPAGANNLRRLTHRIYSTSGTARLSSERVCGVPSGADIASITCPNTTETQVTNYTYWNNTMLPATVTRTNGAGSLSATTTYTYDNAGRVLSEDGPLSGSADASHYRYDVVGRRTWEIGPAGAQEDRRVITRTTYRDADDQPTLVESGHMHNDVNATNPIIFQQVAHSYDNQRRLIRSDTIDVPNNTTAAVMQFSYNARNQVLCEAQRMNPAIFNALPSDACTVGAAGSMGPDQIRSHHYDAMGRHFGTQGGHGVLDEIVFRVKFTENGRILWRRDGNSNFTQYTYDAYDRPMRTTFPGGRYEELSYDARGLVTQRRMRTGRFINFAHDNAGRLTSQTYSSYSPGETPIYYTYDGLGRETWIERIDPDTVDQAVTTIEYDDLGRVESETQEGRQVSYLYDIAGRRTRLTYPDGFYLTYDYSPAGQMTAIRENGSTSSVVDYLYHRYGYMRSIERANGEVTNIVRDPLRRLTRINHVGLSLSDYTYTPASQLLTRSISNTAFVWDDDVEVDLDYAVNDLNQYTSAGATSFTYDHNGNLTDDGTRTYLYDLENRMRRAIGANGGHRMRYDGRGRLLRRWGGGHSGRSENLYDGDSLIAEYNDVTGVMQRRFIHGPGVDDPIIWYEGAGTAAADRRFLHADERGSITAITDNGGAVIHINSYDDWGIPANDTSGVTNIGRFQYTGQQYLPETGLYHYRARMYSPTLGRFMQTDPIGYEDGMNMYAYMHNDPMNGTDPSGMITCEDREFCNSVQLGDDFNTLAGRERRDQSSARGPLTFIEPGTRGGAGGNSNEYSDASYGYEPEHRAPNKHYPTGRIVSGRRLNGEDPYTAALRGADEIANLNGIDPLGEVPMVFPLAPYLAKLPIPLPVGGGWVVYHRRGYDIARHLASRLELRSSPRQGRAVLDIPGGFRIPSGVTVYTESVHYPGR